MGDLFISLQIKELDCSNLRTKNAPPSAGHFLKMGKIISKSVYNVQQLRQHWKL